MHSTELLTARRTAMSDNRHSTVFPRAVQKPNHGTDKIKGKVTPVYATGVYRRRTAIAAHTNLFTG